MNSRNYRQAADSMMIFRICSLVIILMLCGHVRFPAEVSAQEAPSTGKEVQEPDREDAASRIKTLETQLKSLGGRLQAVEGQPLLEEKGDQTSGEGTSPAVQENEPSLKDLERQSDDLEKRLSQVEKAPSANEGAPSSRGPTWNKDGFYLYSNEDAGFLMRLGGGLQVDYRYYSEEDRTDNRFDIRRARLDLSGRLFHLLGYRASYEFEGSEPKNLLDAYGEIGVYGSNTLRFGQFKVPFGLEQQTGYKALFFAERSMGYDLEPRRDVGLGLRGHFFQDALNYAVGVFNGDGTDGSSGGSQQDDPELAGRIVAAPFKTMSYPWLRSFQIGASATYENIDVSNVDLEVQSTGMVDTKLNLYVLNSNTKFGVLHDAGELMRANLEAAWAIGSLTLQGDYVWLKYTDLQGATGPSRDADFSSWYASAVYWLTGEHREFLHGIPQSIKPIRNFDFQQGGWGAFAAYHHEGEMDADKFLAVYPEKAGTKLDHCALCHSGGEYERRPGQWSSLGSCQWCHYSYGYEARAVRLLWKGPSTLMEGPISQTTAMRLPSGRSRASIRTVTATPIKRRSRPTGFRAMERTIPAWWLRHIGSTQSPN